jgi:hypothetical protein
MIFGDPENDDPFHEATSDLLQRETDGGRPPPLPFSLLVDERTADLEATGFEDISFEAIRSVLPLGPTEVRELYATFSPITRLEESKRERLLSELERITDVEFGGRVDRPVVTACYTGRNGGN